MERMEIDSLGMAYRVAGDHAGQPITLIHGYTGNTRNYALQIKPLIAAGWRTLTADNPGHGASDGPDDPSAYTMPAMAARQHALAEALGFVPGVVAGHSMGGAIAEEYAVRYPEHVRALVLIDSAGGGTRGDGPEAAMMREGMAKMRAVVRDQGLAAAYDWQVAQGLRPGVKGIPPEMAEVLRSEFLRTSVPGYLYCGEQLNARESTLERLASLRIPTLVICGENEGPGLRKVADELAATIPNARYEIIKGAGHSPTMETPDAFNAVLLDFLKNL
jgi:pimeloyl-ACP methyl ester carboxylesterase